MNLNLIYEGKATLEDLVELSEKKNYEFVIENGEITAIITRAATINKIFKKGGNE